MRIDHGAYGQGLTLSGYKGAAVRTIALAKNLNIIIDELGIDYLNDLRRAKGRDDGYAEWTETPIDIADLQRTSPKDAAVLAALQKRCDGQQDQIFYCDGLKRAKKSPGLFFTHGDGRIVILEPKKLEMHVAFAGPYTGSR
ncbi:hypothetical protein ELI49_31070 [Rhizobium ruizarguesonis]|uniref:hypothetical protein n=1 Tax=Rhizobium ruizarguesonis TaxID=2081791 RepID=UPI0003674732|nr:hypothetical protein [Rhizobium ruizarguesonis]NEH32624.1 hypothetical protein [Rhizobium ruizarguesonis]NEK13131.1 hypothetical protein [Rhizobium ruizarguesonis]TAT96991.1 hypothetical protein ELI49_31070 [Rhizobium ruizarguesonis]